MLDWKKVEDTITGLVAPKEITKYFKKLISKELKLVAKGKPYYTLYGWVIGSETMKEIIYPYRGKNISIYITNED